MSEGMSSRKKVCRKKKLAPRQLRKVGSSMDMDHHLKLFQNEFFEDREVDTRLFHVRLCIGDILGMEYVGANSKDKYFSKYRFGEEEVEAVEFVGVVVTPGTNNRNSVYRISDGTGVVNASWWGAKKTTLNEIKESRECLAEMRALMKSDGPIEAAACGQMAACHQWVEPMLLAAVRKDHPLPYGHVVFLRGRPYRDNIQNINIYIDYFHVLEKNDDQGRASMVEETLSIYQHIYCKPCCLKDDEVKSLSAIRFADWNDLWSPCLMKGAMDFDPFE